MTEIQLNYLNYLWNKSKQTQELALNERSISETERHNKAIEAQAERELAVSWYQAETARLNYNVNAKNAEVNARNADTNAKNAETNRLNYLVNAYNADTNRLNYGVNAMNAQANMLNAQSNARNADTNARNAALREQELWVSQRAQDLAETQYYTWGQEQAKANVTKTYTEANYNTQRSNYYGASARDIQAKTRSGYWAASVGLTQAQTADLGSKSEAGYWTVYSENVQSQTGLNEARHASEGVSIVQKAWNFATDVWDDIFPTKESEQ